MKIKSVAKNQTELITKKNTIVFFSYETPVCFVCFIDQTVGKTDQFYSQTTVKHINAFFRRYNIDPKGVNIVSQREIDNLVR